MNEENCENCINGSCKSVCEDCEVCIDGACIGCPTGYDCVGGKCKKPCSDDENCDTENCEYCYEGNCEYCCDAAAGEECVDGECRNACEDNSECDTANCEECVDGHCTGCPDCEMCIDGACDPCPTEYNCEDGECKKTCSDESECADCEGCVEGYCEGLCAYDEECVDGECTQPCRGSEDCDAANCEACTDGHCETTCVDCQVCQSGSCQSCPEGTECIDGECKDSCDAQEPCNTQNCEECVDGHCESTCGNGYACVNGNCVPDLPPPPPPPPPGPGPGPGGCSASDDCDSNNCEICVDGQCESSCPDGTQCINGNCETTPVDPDVCCESCGVGDTAVGLSCYNGYWFCNNGICLTGNCVNVSVSITSVIHPYDKQNINCDVTFEAQTIPLGYENYISWLGGGTPATGTGASFTTHWPIPGQYTVSARIDSCDGFCAQDADYYKIEYLDIYDENTLNECSLRITDPSYAGPSPNGCGSSGGIDVPDNPTRDCPDLTWACIGENTDCVNTSFTNTACNLHDVCYGICEIENGSGAKSVCDAEFGANLHTICNKLTGSEYASCYDDCDWWADTYSLSVYLIGGGAFNEAQIEACSCLDCY